MEDKSMARKGNRAYDGENYLGMFLGYKSEFIIGSLMHKLEKGRRYEVSMYVSRSAQNSLCKKSFKTLSVWFVDTIPKLPETDWGLSVNSRFIHLKGENERINGEENWERISGFYDATGDEAYLFLGNFKGANLDVTQNCEALYYYFDNISVVEVPKAPDVVVNTPIVINDIYFSSGKSQLLPKSFESLSTLSEKLKQQKNTSIEIIGHTDNVGKEDDNRQLSEARAKAVLDYLKTSGIDGARLSFTGMGETTPIADNNTEAGRQKNRRVEFKLVPLREE
ncbi:MAG: OmpA family protein [Saprospiraceae bacterium]